MSSKVTAHIAICARVGAEPMLPPPESRLGFSAGARAGLFPLHGLRHPPNGALNGWFIWSGDLSTDPDFFQPTCAHHIPAILPAVLPYLALPPGWRFLIAPGHEDVWFDPALLTPAP